VTYIALTLSLSAATSRFTATTDLPVPGPLKTPVN
jgi:hypothetical protein